MSKKLSTLVILSIATFLILGISFGYDRFSQDSRDISSKHSLITSDIDKRYKHVRNDACVELDIWFDPEEVHLGDELTAAMKVKNCSEKFTRINIDFTIDSNGGYISLFTARTTVHLRPDEEVTISHTRAVPNNIALVGDYTITAVAYVKGVWITEDSEDLEILP